jgi:hypothetical protein
VQQGWEELPPERIGAPGTRRGAVSPSPLGDAFG